MDNDDPMRAKDLSDRVLDSKAKSSTDSDDPKRVMPKTLKDDPICAKL